MIFLNKGTMIWDSSLTMETIYLKAIRLATFFVSVIKSWNESEIKTEISLTHTQMDKWNNNTWCSISVTMTKKRLHWRLSIAHDSLHHVDIMLKGKKPLTQRSIEVSVWNTIIGKQSNVTRPFRNRATCAQGNNKSMITKSKWNDVGQHGRIGINHTNMST